MWGSKLQLQHHSRQDLHSELEPRLPFDDDEYRSDTTSPSRSISHVFPTTSRLTYGSDITSSPDRRVSCLEMNAGKKNANRWIGADVVGTVWADEGV